MMNKVNVMVVEDEFIVAEDIRRNLIKLGYAVNEMARNGEEALDLVKKIIPDVVLLDINLGGGMNGIETATAIRAFARIPIIYVTAHSDKKTFEQAKETAPDAYIIKPFNFNNLHSAIELAIYNYSNRGNGQSVKPIDGVEPNQERPGHYLFNGAIFIKMGKGFEKVVLSEICYIRASGSYSVLYTESREFTIANNLHTVLDRLIYPDLFRVHRSYAVNINCIEKIEKAGVEILGNIIPVSKKIREELMSRVNSI